VAHQHDDSWRELNLASGAGDKQANGEQRWKPQEAPDGSSRVAAAEGADRWADEQLFEEDVRAVLTLMRPNRRERLLGWSEYRTGGAHFRATVSWDEHFELADGGRGKTRVPNMADVLEAILVGSARHDDDLMPAEEFEIYRDVVRELYRRLNDLQSCYE
jgi:hypothetical protein